jgi:hypothetical protein
VSRAAIRLVALFAAVLLVSCEAEAPAPISATAPRVDESRTITDALSRAGVQVDRLTPSKFDWLFGDAAPRAGTYSGFADGRQVWVDVHFLQRPVADVAVCTDRQPGSEWTFTVSLKGQPQSVGGQVTGSVTSPVYFAMNDRYFVIASDLRVLGALRSSLALLEPPCPTRREPNALPVFPEEQAVMAALDAAGIKIAVIGGSKFEGMLGERQRARVFIEQAGGLGAGADILFLDRPIPDIRVCVSQAASGLNRYQILIGDRQVSDGEGTQAVLFSANDRYFVQAIGKSFHEALMKGLGTTAPPC